MSISTKSPSLWVGVASICAALLMGCPSSSEDPAQGVVSEESAAVVAESGNAVGHVEGTEAVPHHLTAKQLQPSFPEVSKHQEAPKRFLIGLRYPIFQDHVNSSWSPDSRYGVPDGFRASIDPEVQGIWHVASASSFAFHPSAPLIPGTTYTLEVEALPDGERILDAPAGGGWSHAFVAPDFEFLDFSVVAVDVKKARAKMALAFSYPVDPKEVLSRLTVKVGGAPIQIDRLERGGQANVLHFFLNGGVYGREDVTATASITDGIPLLGHKSIVARGKKRDVKIGAQGGFEVKVAKLKESATGHFIDVICSDKEAKGRTKHYWDNDTYDSYRLSARCVIDADLAQEFIHFDPEIKFYTARSEHGFRIFGEFERGSYTLRIGAGAATIDGGVLQAPYVKTLDVAARAPSLSFVHKGRYLPKSAWKEVMISHLNLPNATLTIRHIPPENLTFWLSGENEAASDRTSNVLLTRSIPLRSPEDKKLTSAIAIGDILPNPTRGVYELRIEGSGKVDAARMLLTDMNIIAKSYERGQKDRWAEKISVWAVEMEGAALLSGVRIRALRRSGQVMASCFTGDNGHCLLNLPKEGVNKSAPFALIATRGNDLTYLAFEELRIKPSEQDIHGLPFKGGSAYRASVYGDRGVYRPGDSVHLATILRDKAGDAPTAGMPVKLEVLGPRQTILKSFHLKTNTGGMAVADVLLPTFADTGRYQARLTVAAKVVGSLAFSVEEFVPERMKVIAQSKERAYEVGQSPVVEVEANYLFGGTASGSPVEVQCYLESSTFKPERNGEYTYGTWSEAKTGTTPVSLGTVSASLDNDGHAEIACPSGSGTEVVGPGRLRAEVAVFEAGSGRTTTATARAPIHPEAHYVGLKTGAKTAEGGKAMAIEGIVVDWDGRVQKDVLSTVELRFYQVQAEYRWGYWDGWSEEVERELHLVPEGKKVVPIKNGRFQVSVTPNQAYQGYVIQANYGKGRTELMVPGSGGGYWWSRRSRVDQTPRPSKPSELTLKVGTARVGAPVPVSFEAPYRGRVLLTVETDTLVTQAWKDVEPGPVEWQFNIEKFVPNVYVSALLIKDPHLDSPEAFKPDRAFGVVSARVEPTEFKVDLRIQAPKEVRSNSRLTVELDVGKVSGPMFVTVAAVDEGILSLTKFKSPDPLKDIFAQRALGVKTFETVGWSFLVPPGGTSSATGGDGMEALGRVQPVKPVALWSGLVEVPASGKVQVHFDVPQYRGQLRVMAVASGKNRMGSAEAQVLVRDPLVLQTTLPRFLVQGDVVDIPVFVTNLTGSSQDVAISLNAVELPMPGITTRTRVDGAPLSFVGSPSGSLHLEDGAAGTAVFRVRANQTVGAATLNVVVKAGQFESRDSLDVPFVPKGPRVRKVVEVALHEGDNDLSAALSGWVPTTEKSTIWVTANPFAQSFDHMKYLIRYPYGCIEQTTSSTRPLLFVSNLLKGVDPETVAKGRIEDMVVHGIDRVISMQTPSGGFGYWPGGSHISPWAHAYATHMLLDAKAKQYPVSEDALEQAIAWIERSLNSGYASTTGYKRTRYEAAEPYMHYVLAKAEKGRKARILTLIEARKGLAGGPAAENQYLLKAALYLSGDHRYESDLKSPDFKYSKNTRYWGNYYSDVRRMGLTLSVFQDLFGQDPAGLPLAQRVARTLERHSSRYFSTQGLVWGVTGLGRWVGDGNKDFQAPELLAGGKIVTPQLKAGSEKNKDPERTFGLHRASEYGALTLKMKAFEAEQVVALISSDGVREGEGYRLGGQGLKLTRRHYSPEGALLSLGQQSLSLGDLIYVKIDIENTGNTDVQNIALVDRLPAGWEIENPRLGRGGSVDWVDSDKLWSAEHMNLRDDRVELFGMLKRGQKASVVYAVRAVTAGRYTLPPASAEGMYAPELWSRVGGGVIEIKGPWEGLYL